MPVAEVKWSMKPKPSEPKPRKERRVKQKPEKAYALVGLERVVMVGRDRIGT